MKNRLLMIFIAALMIFVINPATTKAFTVNGQNDVTSSDKKQTIGETPSTVESDGGIFQVDTYYSDEGTCEISIDPRNDCANLVIPSSITLEEWSDTNGDEVDDTCTTLHLSVTTLNDMSSDTIRTVSIPSTVTTISDYAFSDCHNLTGVIIPDSVTYLGRGAFSNCNSLASVKIGKGIKEIQYETFFQCSNLTNLDLGDNIEEIGFRAFYNCSSLSQLIIPNSTKTIGFLAFCGCGNLQNVTIGSGVTTLEGGTFTECYNLKITIPKNVTIMEDGALANSDNIVVYGYIHTAAWQYCVDNELTFVSLDSCELDSLSSYVTGGSIIYDTTSQTDKILEKMDIHCKGNHELENDTDYKITITNKTTKTEDDTTNVGTIEVWVTGANGHTGTLTGSITIEPRPLQSRYISLSFYAYEYDGTEIKPDVTVENDYYEELTLGEDYTMKFSNNTNVGTASVTITGIGNYTGTITKTFTIKEADYDGCRHFNTGIANEENATCKDEGYTGDLVCRNCGETLEYGQTIPKLTTHNYTSKITKAATCTENGIRTYTCSVCEATKTEVIPATNHPNTVIRNATSANCRTEGYTGDTYCKDCGDKLASGTIIPKLTTHVWDAGVVTKQPTTSEEGVKTYTCYICGTTRTEAIAKSSQSSPSTQPTTQPTQGGTTPSTQVTQASIVVPGTTLISAKNTKGRKLTIKWQKNTSINGYVIQMSTNKAFTSGVIQKMVYNNQTASLKSQKLKKKKTYYVRVCTYMVVNGQIYYSNWSNVKKVKIKK